MLLVGHAGSDRELDAVRDGAHPVCAVLAASNGSAGEQAQASAFLRGLQFLESSALRSHRSFLRSVFQAAARPKLGRLWFVFLPRALALSDADSP